MKLSPILTAGINSLLIRRHVDNNNNNNNNNDNNNNKNNELRTPQDSPVETDVPKFVLAATLILPKIYYHFRQLINHRQLRHVSSLENTN